jgi:hypothetical protein
LHDLWIESFFDQLSQGPYDIFEFVGDYPASQNIILSESDCNIEGWNKEIDVILNRIE